MSKHTPGPWEIHGYVIYGLDGLRPVAALRGTAVEQRANAKLIAKAPEMLRHIKRLAEDLEDGHWSNTKAVLRALVAKIEGDGE